MVPGLGCWLCDTAASLEQFNDSLVEKTHEFWSAALLSANRHWEKQSLPRLSLQGRDLNVSHTLARKEVAHHRFIRPRGRSGAPWAPTWQPERRAGHTWTVAGEESLPWPACPWGANEGSLALFHFIGRFALLPQYFCLLNAFFY